MLLKAYVWWENLKARLRREDGQALTEYALIIVLVAVAVIAAIVTFRGAIENVFNRISNNLSTP